ncbi:MAG: 3-carboxyethylcatechol 2,3-dioxygenase [Gammaproteobacteria bacterium]|jgi:2,3-dihydroxyphenylpropionate 1,2-dioxygenase
MTVAALCASHTPLKDYRSPGSATARDVAAIFADVRTWVTAYAPDLLVVIAPDHFNGFFYHLMPSFCVGALARGVGDWKTLRGPLPTDPELAERCVAALQHSGTDPALSFDMVVDHGCTQIIEQLFDWQSCPPVLPVFINCAAPPLPPLRRVDTFGKALGTFLDGLGQNILVIGSGGLSHDPPIPVLKDAPPAVRERLIHGGELNVAARNERQQRVLDDALRQTAGTSARVPLNPDWDERFLRKLVADDRESLLDLGDAGISAEAGCGGHEIRTWIAAAACARAAHATDAKLHYYQAIPEWVAGFSVATFR